MRTAFFRQGPEFRAARASLAAGGSRPHGRVSAAADRPPPSSSPLARLTLALSGRCSCQHKPPAAAAPSTRSPSSLSRSLPILPPLVPTQPPTLECSPCASPTPSPTSLEPLWDLSGPELRCPTPHRTAPASAAGHCSPVLASRRSASAPAPARASPPTSQRFSRRNRALVICALSEYCRVSPPDIAMAATAPAPGALSPSGAAAADVEDSNVSSPLSEVDDGDAHDGIEHMRLDVRGDRSSVSGDDRKGPDDEGSDSDSALSDAASDVNSDANDTEAETERLYDTPKNQRQRDVVVDQFNNGQVFEHTPSKLRRTARAGARDDGRDDDSLSGDDASVASSPGGAGDSPTKPATTQNTSIDEEVKRESLERKRKRSPVADQSESDQPLRKRTASVGPPSANADADADDEAPMNEDDTTSANPQSGHQSGGEDDAGSASNRGTPAEAPERETRATKKFSRTSSKRRGASAVDTPGEADSDARDEQPDATAEDEAETHEEEPDGDAEEEADAAAKNIEEMERKSAAFKDWTHIEEMFSTFRDRLYKDRLQRLEEEERSLLADEPTHPEYLKMRKCIDDRLNKRLQEINTEFELRMQAHERRAVAQRAQIWSQFYQAMREKREQALEKLNQQWYEVQSARRSAHSLPDYGLLFPKDPAQRVRNAIAYNTEVSTLAGLAKFEGFPAGPELKGASAAEIEADFGAIDQVRRGRQKPSTHYHQRDEYHTPATFPRLGPAGEQFIKETPWANPNHSAHKLYQKSATLPDGPVHQAANAPPPADVKATIDGQATAHRSPAPPGRKSESPELARTMLNPAAHQMKRVSSIPNLGRGSKTAAA